MLRKMIKYVVALLLLLALALLLYMAGFMGYRESGILGACLYPFLLASTSLGSVFLMAWMWKKICIANGLTPADIDEITKGNESDSRR